MSLALERWRAHHGEHVGDWFETVGQFEALASLASHRYENPEDPFPEILPSSESLTFVAKDLGHPLLRRSEAASATTLLSSRDADSASGAHRQRLEHVRQEHLPPRLRRQRRAGARRRHGASRESATRAADCGSVDPHPGFAAGRRVTLLRRDRAGCATCSTARATEARASSCSTRSSTARTPTTARSALRPWSKSLVDVGALGLVTTHDLALAEIGDADDRLANVHFVDHLEDGKVAFDYVLREGVVTRSNAVELMREVGLLV